LAAKSSGYWFHGTPVVRILGLGVDLAEIDRINEVLVKYPRFAERCFTEHEREYAFRFARPERRLAARFAGKEAVMKSLGTGWRRIRWRDIEITGGGKPTVNMTGSAAIRAQILGVSEVFVTVTHTDTSALVMAVAVGEHE
jgi:holo-[acyl-carrier protein] synthase